MLALTLTSPKRLELLPVEEVEALDEEELLVHMEYAGVQHLDSEMVFGDLGQKIPGGAGIDGVGRVVDSRCASFSSGSRIGFVFRQPFEDRGSWQTQVVLSQQRACITEIPADVAPQEAAAGLTSTIMAFSCLRHFGAGSVLLVPGACGSLGLALLQLGALSGMRLVGLVRGAARVAWIAQEFGNDTFPHGAVQAVDVTGPAWHELVAELCGGHADGAVDGVGGELLLQVVRQLIRPRGTLVRCGAVAGQPDEELFTSVVGERGLEVVHEGIQGALDRTDVASKLQEAMALMSKGTYRPRVWQTVTWHDAAHSLEPQPPWSPYVSQFTEGRIGHLILKFDTT